MSPPLPHDEHLTGVLYNGSASPGRFPIELKLRSCALYIIMPSLPRGSQQRIDRGVCVLRVYVVSHT